MYFPAGINQGLAAALRAPPSGLFIALVIQVPAGTALAPTSRRPESVSNIAIKMLSGRIEGNLHSSSFEFYFGLNWLVTFRTEGTIMQLSGYFMQVVAMQITFREQRQH